MKRIKLASERPPGPRCPRCRGMCDMSIATLSATSYSGISAMLVAGSNNIISLPIIPVNSNFSQ